MRLQTQVAPEIQKRLLLSRVEAESLKELAIMFDDPFERAEEERLELEREELRQCEIRKARIALSMLQSLQRERLMKNVCCGLSSRAIAKQEGVYYSSVDKSIAAAKKNFIKFYENL